MKKKKQLRKKQNIGKKIFKKVSIKTKLLFGIGILLIAVPTFFYSNETIQLAFFTPHVTAVAKQLSSPTRLIIPSVGMDLPIKETALQGNTWQIADDAVSHLAISARPGESGPIILYGHNTNDRLGPIRWLSTGQEILVKTADSKTHAYVISKTEDVPSSKTSELVAVKGETLVLYTCDGFADLQRFLVFATPTSTDK